MAITLDGTSGITTPDITSTAGFDSADLTGDIAAARITTALNATGSAPIYACRAWVNFNGTGTVAIRAAGNVSSITDNGTGTYTINFTNAMPDANYALPAQGSYDITGSTPTNYTALTIKQASGYSTTTSCRINTAYAATSGGGLRDFEIVCVAIFR